MIRQIPLRLGTRGSQLALAQAHETRDRLLAAHPDLGPQGVEIVVFKTTGDRIQDRPLAEVGGKGLFTKELEEALLAGQIDIAVHSMKDMPTVLPDGLVIDCLLPREDPRDALIGGVDTVAALPQGAIVGTSSLRRQAQLLSLRPDLRVVSLRGNVDTRLRKVADGTVAATLLAVAGLRRIGREGEGKPISPDEILPAVAQGAIGIERRAGDDETAALLAPLNHAETAARVTAERAMLAVLDGSCRTPIAGLAEILPNGALSFRGAVYATDGSAAWTTSRQGSAADAARIGADAGEELRARAAKVLN
jgi:hydroxymethylbilane synthase